MADFDELVAEAMTAPFSGWDFSWLDRHTRTEPLPWDYWVRVAALARTLPLGIAVVQDEGARDNDEQNGSAGDRGRLPFRDGSFGLVCNRHDSFCAAESAGCWRRAVHS